jgi:hypothetical protein
MRGERFNAVSKNEFHGVANAAHNPQLPSIPKRLLRHWKALSLMALAHLESASAN